MSYNYRDKNGKPNTEGLANAIVDQWDHKMLIDYAYQNIESWLSSLSDSEFDEQVDLVNGDV